MRQEEQYIINESQGKFFSVFPALKYRNYNLYFWGQLVSLIGTWLQVVAQGWLVLQLTHSAFWVGLVSAISGLPTLFFTLLGGVIVDHFSKKKILIFTQTASMFLAFILGLLTVFRLINVWEILVLAFLLGVVNALDMPARQAFAIEMVGKKDLASAIALNSGVFNGARVIGPGIAGITIAIFGVGGAFILNALSYIAVIFALFLIRVKKVFPKIHPHPLKSIKEGLLYSFNNVTIRILLIFTGLTSIFGWSYSTMMPVIVQHVFHLGADSLGYFYSAAGMGALFGVFLVSSLSKKVNNLVFILGGNSLFVLSIVLFSFTSNVIFALLSLFLSGVGLMLEFSMINTTIQHLVDDHIRGRVMSIYALMFIGVTPIGSFQIGIIAQHFGPQFAIRLGAVMMFIFSIFLFLNRKKIQSMHKDISIDKDFFFQRQ